MAAKDITSPIAISGPCTHEKNSACFISLRGGVRLRISSKIWCKGGQKRPYAWGWGLGVEGVLFKGHMWESPPCPCMINKLSARFLHTGHAITSTRLLRVFATNTTNPTWWVNFFYKNNSVTSFVQKELSYVQNTTAAATPKKEVDRFRCATRYYTLHAAKTHK